MIKNSKKILLPSCPQVSQNSVLMYDGVVVLIQLSAGALMSSHEQDLETTTLSLTVNDRKNSKLINGADCSAQHMIHDVPSHQDLITQI